MTSESQSYSIRPLNLSKDQYLELFEAELPSQLGIVIQIDHACSAPAMPDLPPRVTASLVAHAVKTMIDFCCLREKYLPASIDSFLTIGGIFDASNESFWVPDEDLQHATPQSMDIRVAFFDADAFGRLDQNAMNGLCVATAQIDMLAAVTGTYDPSLHLGQSATSAQYTGFNAAIGDLYVNGIGVWSTALVAARNALICLIEAQLKGGIAESLMNNAICSGLKVLPTVRDRFILS